MTMHADNNVQSPGVGYRLIAGSFIPNGTGAITTKYGFGFTVARFGVGVYTVTIDQSFANFVSIVPGAQFATSEANPHTVAVGDVSVSGKTFQIKHLTTADSTTADFAAADISTSGTANKVNFVCVVAESDIPGAGV